MGKIKLVLGASILFLAGISAAQASIVDYRLERAYFEDGGSLAARFSFETTTGSIVGFSKLQSFYDAGPNTTKEVFYNTWSQSDTAEGSAFQASGQHLGVTRILNVQFDGFLIDTVWPDTLPICLLCVGLSNEGPLLGDPQEYRDIARGWATQMPIPAAVWLFGTALIGLVGFSKRRKAA